MTQQSAFQHPNPPLLCVVDSLSDYRDSPVTRRLSESFPVIHAVFSDLPPVGSKDRKIVFGHFVDYRTGVVTMPKDVAVDSLATVSVSGNEGMIHYTNAEGELITLIQKRQTGDLLFAPKLQQVKSKPDQNYLNLRKSWKK